MPARKTMKGRTRATVRTRRASSGTKARTTKGKKAKVRESRAMKMAIVARTAESAVARQHLQKPHIPAAVTPHVGAMPPGRGDAPVLPRERIAQGLMFLFTVAALMSGGMVFRSAFAATYQGPTMAPPGGNVPTTIWNTYGLASTQTNANITIDGVVSADRGAILGKQNIDLGASAGGQNVLYGVGTYSLMHAQDYLMLLQTEASGAYTTKFTVSKDGNVKAAGCFGPTLAGLTSSSYAAGTSPILSYYAANNTCNSSFAGSHVCTAEEMLQSISCSVAGDPIRTLGGQIAWINGGPPGYTSNSNDCVGWTSNSSSSYGRYWSFDNTTGGYGTTTSCNAPGLKFACCR
jgi:hypothetical protein